jgi:hypothetical protein
VKFADATEITEDVLLEDAEDGFFVGRLKETCGGSSTNDSEVEVILDMLLFKIIKLQLMLCQPP